MSESEDTNGDVVEVLPSEEITAMGLIDLNAVALFRGSFCSIAKVEDIEDLLGVYGVVPGTTRALLDSLVSEEEAVVDAFTFQAMWHSLFPRTVYDRHAHFLRGLSCSTCPRCYKKRQSYSFLIESGDSVSTNCCFCRDKPPCTDSSLLFLRFELPVSSDVSSDQFSKWFERAIGDVVGCAREVSAAYKISFVMSRPSRTKPLLISKVEAEATLHRVMDILSAVEGYRYVSVGTPGNRVRYRCAQARNGTVRDRLVCDTESPDTAQIPRKRRRRESFRVEECRGSIDVLLKEGNIYSLTTQHKMNHESDRVRYKITPELSALIVSLAGQSQTPAQIIQKLRSENHLHVTWNDVHYRWKEAIKGQFMYDENPFISSVMYAKNAENFEIIFEQNAPYALGVVTSIGKQLTALFSCTEVFIDSTYKTNRSKIELFTVLVSVFGVGFPVGYLLLEQSTDDTPRMESISKYLSLLKTSLPSLKPVVFFTDKDKGQISAITSVYGITPSLCYWHLKRAIKRRLQKFRSDKDLIFTSAEEKDLLSVLSRHFNVHPFFSGHSMHQLFSSAFAEIKMRYDNEKYKPLFEYLLKNWYGEDGHLFKQWGRRCHGYVAFARTTMFVEGHWSSLKRNYLIYHNRPRLDFLLYIIDVKLLPKYYGMFDLIRDGKIVPAWFKAMRKEWNKKKGRGYSDRSYHTEIDRWICTCPSYYMSKFLICKHLIAGQELPFARELTRNSSPPFWEFKKEEGRMHPLVERLQTETCTGAVQLDDTGEVREICLPEESPTKSGEGGSFDMEELSTWFLEHVRELRSNPACEAQLSYVEKNIAPRLEAYRENVTKNERSSRTPTTWANRDTIFLP